jgi:LSD1 subclass zinc finger protein
MEIILKRLQNTKSSEEILKLDLDRISNSSSLTALLLEMSRRKILLCPGCRNPLNLEHGVEWQGPLDVRCRLCKTLINIKTLLQF